MRRALVVLGILAAIATPAAAVPGPVAGTIEVGAASVLEYGGYAVFDVETTGTLRGFESLRVWVRCYQGGEWVWQQSGSPEATFVLGNGAGPWQGGAADCTADLLLQTFSKKIVVAREDLDQVAFAVAG